MGLIFSVISCFIYFTETNKFVDRLSIKENNLIQLQHNTFKNELSGHIKNALFLAELIQLKNQEYLEAKELSALTNAFVKMMKINDVYDQIRWIDNQGMELIRIDHSEDGPKIIPVDQLQDKSGRYYFKEGMAGPRIYISKFDLNIEHEIIQLPVKPMIRITAIVQDAVGGNDGLVVLNVKGRQIIEKFKEIGKQMTGSLALINSDGYYLISPNPDEEWAFMYPKKISKNLKTINPHLWSEIKAAGSRQRLTPRWLVTYVTVDMASTTGFGAGYGFHTAESWKIVSLIPPELLIPEWRSLFLFGVLSILLIMAGACFYWATAKVNRTEAEKTIFENEEKFQRVTQTMDDAVIMIDENDIIQFWSDSGNRMLGYSAKETLGRRLHEIVFQHSALADGPKKTLNFHKKAPKDRSAQIMEANAVRKDGTGLPVEISIMPLVQNGKQLAVGIVKDLSDKKKAEEEKKDLFELSTTDGLTGLANRRFFDEVLQDEYTRHSRSGGDLSLIFIDIDHFKALNDTYGHINGDHSLQRVAQVLGTCAHRRSDLVARYGGEEFACILPETGNYSAVKLAKKIQKEIVSLAIPNQGSSVAPYLTVSIGIATVSCTFDQSAEYILSQADKQLYAAKESGRNRIESVDLTSGRHHMDRNIIQLVWKDAFYCGHDLIDGQHKALFNHSNQIFSAITSNRPISEIHNLFTELIEGLRRHFADEEEVLHTIGYIAIAKHAKEHARLLAEADRLSQSFEASTMHVGETFQFFVKEIVMLHMMGMDRDFYPFIGENPVR